MDSLGINSVFENVPEEEKPLLLGFKTGIATPEPGMFQAEIFRRHRRG